MAEAVEFDRDLVGVAAKRNWEDSEAFAGIARFIRINLAGDAAVTTLDGTGDVGTSALRDALDYAQETMAGVTVEFSDTCALLGSGGEDAVDDFDATEYRLTESYQRLRDLMGE